MKSKKTKTTIDKWTDREVGKHRVVAITWPDIDDVPYFSMQCKRHNSSKWIDCDDLYVAVSRLVVLNLANKSMNEMLDCYYKQIEKLEEKLDKMTRKKELWKATAEILSVPGLKDRIIKACKEGKKE